MADPLSVAGSIAGLVSLSIQVTGSIVKFYDSYQGQGVAVDRTTGMLKSFLSMLQYLHQRIQERKFQPDEQDLIQAIESSIENCEDLIYELRDECEKLKKKTPAGDLKAVLKVTGRRALYPFKESTLKKLEEDIGEMRENLTFALNALQVEENKNHREDIADVKLVLDVVRADQITSTICDWLKAPDVTTNHNSAVAKCHSGTGMWLVRGAKFENWLAQNSSLLWLNGFAGSGKSVLCSTAIQYTCRKKQAVPDIVGIAFFYFTFNDKSKQDASGMLRALLLQLSGQLHDGYKELERLHKSYKTGTPPTLELAAYLHSLIQRFQHVYIFLDALDESPRFTYRDEVLDIIMLMRSWSLPGMHLLVTSKDEIDIRNRLNPTNEEEEVMRNDAIDQDISKFISTELQTNQALHKWKADHDKIQKALTERAGGVFRWVECQFQALKSCLRSERKLNKCLEGLPRDLDETYERMLCNIDEDAFEEARRMLTLLCYSVRPLTVSEVIDGIAVSLDEPAYLDHQRRLEGADDLHGLCPGLISIVHSENRSKSPTVHIAHFSVQEYLQSHRITAQKSASFSLQGDLAHTEIAHISLVYLMEPDLSLDMPNVKLPLAEYAAQFWYDHYKDAGRPDYLEGAILRMFRLKRERFHAWAMLYEGWDRDEYSFSDLDTDEYSPSDPDTDENSFPDTTVGQPLYYASLFGLTRVVQDIIESSSSHAIKDQINPQYTSGLSHLALVAASKGGFAAIVQILLDNGADINLTDSSGSNALIAASFNGCEEIVHLLLDRGAEINALGDGGTALYAASKAGYENVVQLLLDRGADINASGFGDTPLLAAFYEDHGGIVQLLLANGADIHAKGVAGTALYLAAKKGHKSMVQLLLDRGVDINAIMWDGHTALHAASGQGHESIVRLLLDRGADVNAMGLDGPALRFASSRGLESIVKLLLDHGADVNLYDENFGSALITASSDGHVGIVKLLLKSGANVNIWGELYGSPLEAASSMGHIGIVEMLLESGADPNAQGLDQHDTAIWEARRWGHQDVVKLLLDHGATPLPD
ncbi:ankyrin repeat-containing protein [Nannizzia gypsea CBS 118893]|uniref:Ankyrin repeat-containing protein n=1 Tax=Arthroderma gypseum (strain ATCC MYA-4604 / CBS 118893) TaxID=535722 RepID=E4UR48_ARTGP|nr:ankyrin repeat-containing protein [Nannizzia gypsea CBS 118893]EFQ99323.1 ankyrin repeat-containing protein [Nannizzia gypsea CBS 118893]